MAVRGRGADGEPSNELTGCSATVASFFAYPAGTKMTGKQAWGAILARASAVVVGLCLAVVLPASASAAAGQVIHVTIEGKQFRPAAINVHDGDVLHICSKDPFSDSLFSLSPHNRFGAGSANQGLRFRDGSCADVTLHDPTGQPINVRIFSHQHSQERLRIAVYPKADPLPRSPVGIVPTSSPPPTTFTLDPSLTQVQNVDASELTITSTPAGNGVVDHTGPNGGAGKGGEWKIEYDWTVPSTLTSGKQAEISMQIKISEVNPQQPLSIQMNAIAPGFAQALPCQYPAMPSCAMTFPYTVAEDQVSAGEITIDVGFDDSHVIFHYKPSK